MRRVAGLICTYLTVAVLLGLSVAPSYTYKAGQNIADVYNKHENALSEQAANDLISEPHTENMTEEVQISDRKPENEAPSEKVSDNTQKEAASSECELSEVILPQYSSYAPSASDKVSGLNFFTETQGKLNSSDSVNVYTFSVDTRGVFRYTFSHEVTDDSAGWRAELYQEYLVNGTGEKKAYRLLNTLNTTNNSSDSSPEIGLIAGNYRLVVTKNVTHDDSVYRISVTFDEGAKYEAECNDNIYRYTEIYSDVPVKGSASCFSDRQDEDYYMLRMYSDGYIELEFSHPEVKDLLSVCWQVIFYSEDMTEIFSENSVFSEGGLVSGRIGLPAGNYYIAVINRVYTDITYTLNIKRTEIDGFENERNDTYKTANAFPLNSTVTGTVAAQLNGLDRDCFRLDVYAPGVLIIEFSHNPLSDADDKDGWNFRLTDENGNVIYAGVSKWADDVAASTLIGISEGTYYVVVDSEGLYHSTERYYISSVFTEKEDWESEVNDSFTDADSLESGVRVNGVLSERSADYDYDFFTLELKKKSNIGITFSHEKLLYSREIFTFTLYDENFNAVKNVSSDTLNSVMSDLDSLTAEYENLSAGRYYIKVSAGIFFDSIGYSLMYETNVKES